MSDTSPRQRRVATSRDLDRLLNTARSEPYRCPGESYSINRAVHLSRLQSGYEACRHCPHRQDGDISGSEIAPSAIVPLASNPAGRLWKGSGWRGIALNEATRARATDVTTLFASHLRDALGHTPRVILAHDTRGTSPELFVGATTGLRRGGAALFDAGPVHQPLAWHLLRERAADGVVYVTGAGCDPDWNGLDFTLAGPWPVSPEIGRGDFAGLRELVPAPGPPQSHLSPAVPGSITPARRFESYGALLAERFHALRPLGIVAGIPPGPQGTWLRRALAATACRLVEIPVSISAQPHLDPPSTGRVVEALIGERRSGTRVDLAVLFHEDGFRVTVFDELGQVADNTALTRLLGAVSSPTTPFHEAFWFRSEAGLECDALLTLANLLRVLSERDLELSRRLEDAASSRDLER